ncbi:hypothetical protein [Burkholderia sp. PAMC 28687]|nr:hypothetical protein [Burkholderia sp. PAMC 28687]
MFDTGMRGLQHGAAWISRRRAAVSSQPQLSGRSIGTGILFEL